MSDSEAPPVKRGPGRPRKAAASKVQEDAWKAPDTPPVKKTGSALPDDERVGLSVDDLTTTQVGYDDGRVYRVENGKLVERIA